MTFERGTRFPPSQILRKGRKRGYLEAWVERGKAPDTMIGVRLSDSYVATAPLPGKELAKGAPPNMTPEARRRLLDSFLKFPFDPSVPVSLSRPFFPYPFYAKFKGSGDPNDASNFIAVSPH